ncbi:transcription elongation factor GreA [Helicobacter sp. MIT 14-3879]|uniref:transcription elongation factor GreA n=1 Tax=Helicobacter sp. MIT 14-3879 TaxID=2040649 RepID=UPI000E1FA7D9|nr:transcription elongation factor GreA [Helicobacter sp. MIT 14-3879]RDU64804.1 transcription elongation factor GreA [Helicobacter sp. MIT 14-3879]
MQKEPMTEYGYKKLCEELKNLKEVERPNIVKEIDTARSYGDLKENAEYHAAREKQAFIEARIVDLGKILANVQIINPKSYEHKSVSFGSTIYLLDLESDKKLKYTIVGSYESNPEKGYISFHSPIAKSILGKNKGDEVSIILPRGESEFEILDICYEEIVF